MEKKAIIKTYALSCFDDVKIIIFLDNAKNAGNEVTDYSFNNDMSVVGWRDQNNPNILYVAPTIGNKIYIVKRATSLFYNSQYLEEIKGIEVLDTSETTDMCAMFCGCRSLTSLDLSSFDTSNVENMFAMFTRSKLSSIDVSKLNTCNVKNMSYMFAWCKSLENIDIFNFDVSKVVTMAHMFDGCTNLVRLRLPRFTDQDLKRIDTDEIYNKCDNLMVIR